MINTDPEFKAVGYISIIEFLNSYLIQVAKFKKIEKKIQT